MCLLLPANTSLSRWREVLLGDTGVGKSSLALRFCQGRFPPFHEARPFGVDAKNLCFTFTTVFSTLVELDFLQSRTRAAVIDEFCQSTIVV